MENKNIYFFLKGAYYITIQVTVAGAYTVMCSLQLLVENDNQEKEGERL